MSIADKLTTIAKNVPKVYEAGQKSMVDESKIIPKTVTGKRFVFVDDVSEVRHSVEINVSSDCGISVCGKNLCPNDWEVGYISSSTGLNQGGSSYVRTKDYFTFNKNQINYISSDDLTESNTITWFFYDENKTFIRRFVSYKDRMIGLDGVSVVIPENASFYRLAINTTDVNVRVQLEKGSVATAYESYHKVDYTTQNGTAIVKSLSPYMTVIADSDVDITMNYRKSYGIQTEYDRFWDAYQENGNRTSYRISFSGYGWSNKLFNPKYNMDNISDAYGMFWNSRINGDLVEILKNLNISFDSSKAKQYHYMFADCKFTRVGEINATGSDALSSMFSTTSNLKTIDKLILKEDGSNTFSTAFYTASALENITIEGVIGQNLDIHWSPLTHDSIMSIINHLQTKTSGTFTLTLGSTNLAKLTDAEKAIATEKGWTLA